MLYFLKFDNCRILLNIESSNPRMIQERLIKIARSLLSPFSILYALVMQIRNVLFDVKILHATQFDIPVIAVGNLSVGGTGKTPQIEYLIELLKPKYKIAVLSRGYKRTSKGFILATTETSVVEIGDEPFQYKTKYPEIVVAVDSDRTNGINKIKEMHPEVDLVLLDDAFQHRKVTASFYILLTSFDAPYSSDYLLPLGNLREPRSGYRRADAIVVTKCSETLAKSEKKQLVKALTPKVKRDVFFSKIAYAHEVHSDDQSITINSLKNYRVLLVTGIAKPKPLLAFLEDNEIAFDHMSYPDHHNFTNKDIQAIEKAFGTYTEAKKIMLTTEKDNTRLKGKLSNLFSIAIRPQFLENETKFEQSITNHIDNFH